MTQEFSWHRLRISETQHQQGPHLGDGPSAPRLRPRRPCRGFALVELLIVVTIILIVTIYYFRPGGGGTADGVSTYKRETGRANNAACAANRAAYLQTLEVFRIENSGVPATPENLSAKGYKLPTCPEGGTYTQDASGLVACSVHGGGAASASSGSEGSGHAAQADSLSGDMPGRSSAPPASASMNRATRLMGGAQENSAATE